MISFLDVELEEEIGKISVDGEIICMNWTENTKEIESADSESCPYNPVSHLFKICIKYSNKNIS